MIHVGGDSRLVSKNNKILTILYTFQFSLGYIQPYILLHMIGLLYC